MKQKVNLYNTYNLESLKVLLSRYFNFKECARDIKIESIFNKKTQFDITDIKPPIVANFSESLEIYNNSDSIIYHDLKGSVISISSIFIIFESDGNISEIVVEFTIINDKFKILFANNIVKISTNGYPYINGFVIELQNSIKFN